MANRVLEEAKELWHELWRVRLRWGAERLDKASSPPRDAGPTAGGGGGLFGSWPKAEARNGASSVRSPSRMASAHIHVGHRSLYVNSREENLAFGFKDNSVSTTKYSLFTFLPKGLFEQFRRVANLYFLLIAILSATPVSPVHPITNIAPLSIVLAISLLKEAFEDRKRFISDRVINGSQTEVLVGSEFVKKPWSDVMVGDIIRVQADQFFPADLLCLASTNPDGVCYIETMNLDGETNLKIRKALEQTWEYVTPQAASQFVGATIECEQPNNSLYTFTGNLLIGKQTVIPITPNQILLRGCSLRNTEYIVGAVIFTGHQSKVMMNAMDVPSKRSTLERRLDSLILLLFFVLFGICFVGSVGSAVFMDVKYWYLALEPGLVDAQNDPKNPLGVFVLRFFTLVTLYSCIIPISLYVSIEMIKFMQVTQFVNNDIAMYHRESNTPAHARTSNLNEELGQIEYIFSDKTGTLTRNLMEFFKCSIGGVMYGTGITEIQRSTAARQGSTLREEPRPEDAVREKGFNFHDRRLMKGAWRKEATPEICMEFFRLLAICHTVLPEGEESPDSIVYQASSPDELALVTAAKNFGFFFHRRSPTGIRVREAHVERMGKLTDSEYEILNVLEFNSTRKRQSVICRFSNGRLVLYCKGADTVIYERLADSPANSFKETTRTHLEQFGADGLRTLCLAYADLDPDEYEAWNQIFVMAKSALTDRERKLDEAAELIEKKLILLGATAIEDKLQEGVPMCIETLARAGIKIWVLTGDKMETAINIAYACSLLTNNQRHFIISSETDEIRASEDRGDTVETARLIRASVQKELKEALDEALRLQPTGAEIGLVIDGRCLMYALDPSFRKLLLELGMLCKAVVCCRVSPLQKAQVTTLIRDGAGKITLSIGDGANDVSMIQAAHIGIGISGQEGMQAVMASDFSIAQFRFLADLLLVHGRYSYLRISKVVSYFFYKNLAFTLTQFWFNCYTGYSGQRFFDDWFQSMYNVVFTALPVIVVGILDQDVSPTASRKFPQLYAAGINNQFFNWHVMGVWLFFAVFQSLIFFFFPAAVLEGPVSPWGRTLGIWELGTASYTVVIITVNIRLMMACDFLTRAHHAAIWGSIGGWFLFVLFYCGVRPGQTRQLDTQDNLYASFYYLLQSPNFLLILILGPITALLGDFLLLSVQRWFRPSDYQIVQEKMIRDEPSWHIRRLEIERDDLFKDGPVVMTAEDERTMAMTQLPSLRSEKHTGFAFDSPGFESFFAMQEGVKPNVKAWDVARTQSMNPRRRLSHQDSTESYGGGEEDRTWDRTPKKRSVTSPRERPPPLSHTSPQPLSPTSPDRFEDLNLDFDSAMTGLGRGAMRIGGRNSQQPSSGSPARNTTHPKNLLD